MSGHILGIEISGAFSGTPMVLRKIFTNLFRTTWRNNMKPLEREFHYYLAHQDELVRKYNGKYIVIQETTVLGAYNSEWEAVQEMTKQGYELGTFLVQRCEPGEDAYTVTFPAEVTFA